jgi:hypothetical protein
MARLTLIFSLLFLQACSCHKQEKTYTPTELWKIAIKADPSIELVMIPESQPERRVLCQNYPSDGCLEGSGRRILISKVELLALQYENPAKARAAAYKIDQWYAGDWLFDDVTNEPVLENFVQKVFNAKRPTLENLE